MGANVEYGKNFISVSKNELNAIDADLHHIPDAAMTMATTGSFLLNGKPLNHSRTFRFIWHS